MTRWDERRIVSMHDPHFCALSLKLTPENWSGDMHLRAGLDGSVLKLGRRAIPRPRRAAPRDPGHVARGRRHPDPQVPLRGRARREVALAARTSVAIDGGHVASTRSGIMPDNGGRRNSTSRRARAARWRSRRSPPISTAATTP